MSERIALIGAGAMGGAIGLRLLETGNALTVFDLDRAKIDALAAKGATPADTCLLYTSPSPRDLSTSRMPSSA